MLFFVWSGILIATWWPGARTDSHGVAALEFYTLLHYRQLTVGPTHLAGDDLDLFMFNVPEIYQVSVCGAEGGCDQSFAAATITTAERVPDFCVARRVYQKNSIHWNAREGRVKGFA